MKFNKKETSVLLEAIKQYRGREGSFSSNDPIVKINGKLNEDKNINTSELKNIIAVINENIIFLKSYNYTGLSHEQSKINKENIIVPLEKIKATILNYL